MSILRALLLLLVSVITLLSFSAAIAGYQASLAKAEQMFDENLENLGEALASLSNGEEQPIWHFREQMAYQVWNDSKLLSHSANAPLHSLHIDDEQFGFNNFDGRRWRTHAHAVEDSRRVIMIAESLNSRIELAEDMALASLSPLLISTPLLALVIVLVVTTGLRPLKELSAKLKNKAADDLTPIKLSNPPSELRPVQSTINRLLGRVHDALEREKRFASDAAHELRTPISVLQVSLYNLLDQRPELDKEIASLQHGVQRMSYVIEQILMLNRTHPHHMQLTFTSLDLTAIAQQAIAECFAGIDQRQQTIELAHASENDAEIQVYGDEFSLQTMLQNLIGNASKYTPEQGLINLNISSKDGFAVLQIDDSGPGIKAEEQDRVLDRFYRSEGDQHSSNIKGCGLGLAIVRQVCDLHNGELDLQRSTTLGGLRVIVSLPLSAH